MENQINKIFQGIPFLQVTDKKSNPFKSLYEHVTSNSKGQPPKHIIKDKDEFKQLLNLFGNVIINMNIKHNSGLIFGKKFNEFIEKMKTQFEYDVIKNLIFESTITDNQLAKILLFEPNINIFIDAGYDLNKLLVIAVANNQIGHVKLLLNYTKISVTDKIKLNEKHYNNFQLVKLLVENGFTFDNHCTTFLSEACSMLESTDIIELIVPKHNKQQLTQILYNLCNETRAGYKDRLEIYELLITNGADVNYSNAYYFSETSLIRACRNGHINAVKSLIIHKANVNHAMSYYGITPIIAACQHSLWTKKRGDYEIPEAIIYNIVKLLLENGADPNHNADKNYVTNHANESAGLLALMLACDYGLYDVIKLLLQYCNKEVINRIFVEACYKTRKYSTFFARYQRESNIKVINVIVQSKNIDLDYVNGKGNMALLSCMDDDKCFELLIKQGKDHNVNYIDEKTGDSMLMMIFKNMASHKNNGVNNYEFNSDVYKNIAFLIRSGANINHVNKSGISALMYVCQRNMLNGARLLIKHSADITLVDNEGKSALDHCDSIKINNYIIKCLAEHQNKMYKDEPKSTELMSAFNKVLY